MAEIAREAEPARLNRDRARMMTIPPWRRDDTVKKVVVYSVLILWSLLIFFPIYWLLIGTIKPGASYGAGPKYIPWVDFVPHLRSWQGALFGGSTANVLLPTYLNSVVISITSSSLALVFGSMAAYGLARFEYRLGRISGNTIAFWIIMQRMFPTAVLLMPYFLMYRQLGLLDTRTGLIIIYTGMNLPFVVWIMRGFFAGVPPELEESALIDGCTRLGAFFRISIPLAAPGLVSVFIFCIIFAWNEFIFAIVLTFINFKTMPILLTMGGGGGMGIATVLSMLPAFVAALILEKHITKGLTMGSIK